MASTSQSRRPDQSLLAYYLVWLDAASQSEENLHVQDNLQFLINHFQVFDRLDPCQAFLQSCSIKSRIIFIVSGDFCRQIIPQVHHLLQIFSIYIFCSDRQLHHSWSEQYDKVTSTFQKDDCGVSCS